MSTIWPLRILPPKHGCSLSRGMSGPFASRFLTTVPVCSALPLPFPPVSRAASVFPLPLSERAGQCRRPLDPVGDHCAAGLARSGAEGAHERAAARVRGEAGTRVTTNTRLAGLNLVNSVKDRR